MLSPEGEEDITQYILTHQERSDRRQQDNDDHHHTTINGNGIRSHSDTIASVSDDVIQIRTSTSANNYSYNFNTAPPSTTMVSSVLPHSTTIATSRTRAHTAHAQIAAESEVFYNIYTGNKQTDSRSNKRGTNFVATSFKYNTETFILAASCLLPILAYAGPIALGILATGLVIAYILDFLGKQEWTLIVWWVALCSFWLTIYASSIHLLWDSAINLFILLNTSAYIMMIGFWGTLQFKWFQSSSPDVIMFMERALFSVFPIVCIPLLMNTILTLTGGSVLNVPFYLAFVMCALLHFFYTPKKSSFKLTTAKASAAGPRKETYVQGKVECLVATLLALLLPTLVYIVLNHNMFSIFNTYHLVNVCILVATPIIFLVTNPSKYLWWLGVHEHRMKKLRNVALSASICLFLAWFEYRIVFSRYYHLLAVPPPLSYLLVTLALYSFAAVAIIMLNALKGPSIEVATYVLSIAGALFGSIAVGFPIYLIPAPVLAAYCAASFYLSRSWKFYYAFAAAAVVAIFWWLSKSFSFLEYEFNLSFLPMEWTLRIQHATFLMCALVALGLCAIPLCAMNYSSSLIAACLTAHAVLLAFLEQVLYEQGEGFYSPMLILVTTTIGLYMILSLHKSFKVTPNGASLVMSVYLSKLAILMAPHHRMALVAAFFFSISFVRLYLAMRDKETITLGMGWAYVLTTGVAVLLTRNILLIEALEFLTSTSGHAISGSRLLGTALFVWGLGLLPLSFGFMRNVGTLKRLNLLLLIAGAVWSVWQPSFSIGAEHSNLYKEIIQPWIIFSTIVFTFSTLMSLIPVPRNTLVRMGQFITMGFGCGYVMCDLFLDQYSLNMITLSLVCLTFVLASLVLYASHFPPFSSYKSAQYLYFSLLGTVPTTFLSFQFSKVVYNYDDAVVSLLAIYTALNIFLAFVIKSRLTGRSLLQTQFSSSSKSTSGTTPNKRKPEDMLSIPGSDELAVVGNMCTIASYVLALNLNVWFEWNYGAFILISIIFLLLHRDSIILRDFKDENRYLVIVAVAEVTLVALFVLDCINNATTSSSPSPFLSIIKNLFLFAASLPSQYLLLQYVYRFRRPVPAQLLVSLPLNLIVLFLNQSEFAGSAFNSLSYYSIIGVGAVVFQLFIASQYARQGTTMLL